jgi:predicted dehydrogenase (TIGR03970 family)
MGAAVPGAPQNWDLEAVLSDGVVARVPRGRVVGGSSALYAGSFLRGTPADFDGWAAEGNDLWSYARVLPAFRRLEADRDHGDSAVHGGSGPVPVVRPATPHPLAEAVAAAAGELGFPAEPDKNAGGPPGYGPVPCGVADGVRVNTAMAYLSPRRGLPHLAVRGGAAVRRVLLESGRAVGVVTDAGTVRAAEVVLSAGAVGSAHLLLRSGIGPAADLRAAGLPVVADLPVGRGFTDHPGVYLFWRPVRRLPVPVGMPPLHGVLHTAADGPAGADLEILPWLAPFPLVMRDPAAPPPAGAADDDLALGVVLQQAGSRGRLTLARDRDAQPRIEHRYLAEEADRRRMRGAVRLAAELLRTPPVAGLVAGRTDLPDRVLADDRALDGWIRRRLSTTVHLSGTARMGPDGDPGAVVDQQLRVRGVAGLRVADTSVMPRVTSRGPAATAVMIGERAAELMTSA